MVQTKKSNIKNTIIAIKRGWAFLEQQSQAGFYECWIGESRELKKRTLSPREIFSTIVIFETLLKHHIKDKLAIDALDYLFNQYKEKPLTFFENRSLYPPDVDVLSLAGSILYEFKKISLSETKALLTTVLGNTDKQGIIQVWITDDKRPKRRDHIAATNAVYLSYLLNQNQKTQKTEDWLFKTLSSDLYLEGSRYYSSPVTFLYFLNRVNAKFPSFNHKFNELISKSVNQLANSTTYPLDIAMRMIISETLKIHSLENAEQLIKLQNTDGSWPADALFRYGSHPKYFGSEAIVTAFCIRALELSI